MNDCLTMYIETDVVSRIDNEDIMQQFQNMKQHRRLFFFGDVDIFNLYFV